MTLNNNVVDIETAVTSRYNPQWIMDNRPSDDTVEISQWLQTSYGVQKHLASRCADNFLRACMCQLSDIKIEFKPLLETV